jgi:competence protein ComEC
MDRERGSVAPGEGWGSERGRVPGWRAGGLSLPALAAAPLRFLEAALSAERARWFVWVPVIFGSGISLYFHLRSEPSLAFALALPVLALALMVFVRGSFWLSALTSLLIVASLGFAAAKVRTEWVRSSILPTKMRAADVRGQVTLVEPKGKGHRLTLRVSAIAGLDPADLPHLVRIWSRRGGAGLVPGDFIRIRASLSPPFAPALPGGYDFGRAAWYARLGAVGYAIKAPERLAPLPGAAWSWRVSAIIERGRQAIGQRIRAVLPSETGGIANSLITGERGGISEETANAFRDSGLFHILSISGLHMVIMAGSVYGALRLCASAFPFLALGFAIKKWSAAIAVVAGFAYLLISGSSVATVRAFIMISIMLLAVMLDRPALAMRNVALAALAILTVMPESLLHVGFQMSFAAVISLISAYEAARRPWNGADYSGISHRVVFFFGGIVASTLIASLAVAPFAAYHFHRSQQYALLANLVAVPICNFVVMPAALLTLLSLPFGAEALPLVVMGWGVDVMAAVAHSVASLPGAVVTLSDLSTVTFGLLVFGGLWLALWRARWRYWGVAIAAGGLVLAPSVERPDILAGVRGTLVAARADDGRLMAVSRGRAPYELKRWLEHDGDGRPAKSVVAARGFACDGSGCTALSRSARVAVVRHPSAFSDDCRFARVLVARIPVPADCVGPEILIGPRALARKGTHAIYFDDLATPKVVTVADVRGLRPWSQPRRFRSFRKRMRSKRRWRRTRRQTWRSSVSTGG